jgi:hypothetical protein
MQWGGTQINDCTFQKNLKKLETTSTYTKANRRFFEVLANKTISYVPANISGSVVAVLLILKNLKWCNFEVVNIVESRYFDLMDTQRGKTLNRRKSFKRYYFSLYDDGE